MKKLLGAVLLASLLLVGCSQGDKDASKKDTLVALTNSGYKPYEMVNKDGDLYGFDIEMTEKAAKIAGYKIKWEDIDFDGIIDSLKTNKGDLAVAGFSPTPERAKQVDMSDFYYSDEANQNYVLTLADNAINSAVDIKDKTVGVQMSTIQEGTAKELEKEYSLSIDSRKSYVDLVSEMKTNKVDFMIVEKAVANEFVQENADLKSFKLGVGTDPSGNVMAFKKDSKLTAKFNEAIKTMIDNGEMDKLIKKYFD